jgi:nanoRNase/pAp phosphatase (c-di-AMP/oligoRNAs hydrolase)
MANKQNNEKYQKLISLFKDKSTMLIVLQDNPDPDAIGCAVGLRKLANQMSNIRCTIAHGGMIGRGENRALVKYLNLNLYGCDKVDFSRFDLIAMVDAQPGAGNSSLPDNIIPNIVIDHHPRQSLTRKATYSDIRSKYGATSTIILEYLKQAKIEIDRQLATALLYGIRSDTQDLGRDAKRADIKAIEYLYPLANKRMLSEIIRGSVPREYFLMLSDALQNAVAYKDIVITHLGPINNPDIVGEVADLLLREEKTFWTLCSGVFEDKMLLSIRTLYDNVSAGEVMSQTVNGYGTGGGHSAYAGGQIPLADKTKNDIKGLPRLIEHKFLKTLGASRIKNRKFIE